MTSSSQINDLLEPFQHFGVHLGLERIKNLLNTLNNPHEQVPIIHVAGTNGKGSVCAYLSSILTEAGYKVGRYISPHLINWNERICINEKPISSEKLADILLKIKQVIDPQKECPTLFEVITTAAWLYFAESQVDIAVIEVGLGGRLDATNVCDNPLITVITSISKEHWQRLGSTLTQITTEKAGILKKNCPAVIGVLPEEAKNVVMSKVEQLNCPTVWVKPATELIKQDSNVKYAVYDDIEYPLSLLGNVQLINSAIAISCLQILRNKGWEINLKAIQEGMRKTRWQGRIEWTTYKNHSILIDGAHNPSSAKVLSEYVNTLNKPAIWIMGMLSTKDHKDIFKAILRQQDDLYLVPVPDRSTAEPKQLSKLALETCPQIHAISTFEDIFLAVDKAIVNNSDHDKLIVICGSLYLLGYFLANNK